MIFSESKFGIDRVVRETQRQSLNRHQRWLIRALRLCNVSDELGHFVDAIGHSMTMAFTPLFFLDMAAGRLTASELASIPKSERALRKFVGGEQGKFKQISDANLNRSALLFASTTALRKSVSTPCIAAVSACRSAAEPWGGRAGSRIISQY